MIFRRRDPAEERRKRIKKNIATAGIIGGGAAIGARIGRDYTNVKHIGLPLYRRTEAMNRRSRRVKYDVDRLKAAKRIIQQEKNPFLLHIAKGRKKVIRKSLRQNAKIVSKLKKSSRNFPTNIFAKPFRGKTIKNISAGAAFGAGAGVAGIAGTRALGGYLHKRRKEKEYAAMSYPQRMKSRLRSAFDR